MTPCESDVQKTTRCSFHHLDASKGKRLFSCVLRDGASTQTVLVLPILSRESGAEKGLKCVFKKKNVEAVHFWFCMQAASRGNTSMSLCGETWGDGNLGDQ